MNNLKIIHSTTRQGRKGIYVANWFTDLVNQTGMFHSELLDLAVINLPFMDEPNHPRLQKYQHEHTKRWSAIIEPADCFVIVLAEYNFGFPAPIKNALDFLYNEWKYKPVAFVSYGGIAGGMRSMQMLKQVLSAMYMVAIVEAVNIPFFSKYIDQENKFVPEEVVVKSAHAMLKELDRWANALKVLREV